MWSFTSSWKSLMISLSFAKLVGSDGWIPRIGFLRKILLSRIDESCLLPKETDPGRARWSSWYGRASWLNLEEDLKLNIFNWNFISPNRESVWIFEKTCCHRYLKEMQNIFFMVEASFKYVRVRENNEKNYLSGKILWTQEKNQYMWKWSLIIQPLYWVQIVTFLVTFSKCRDHKSDLSSPRKFPKIFLLVPGGLPAAWWRPTARISPASSFIQNSQPDRWPASAESSQADRRSGQRCKMDF